MSDEKSGPGSVPTPIPAVIGGNAVPGSGLLVGVDALLMMRGSTCVMRFQSQAFRALMAAGEERAARIVVLMDPEKVAREVAESSAESCSRILKEKA